MPNVYRPIYDSRPARLQISICLIADSMKTEPISPIAILMVLAYRSFHMPS